MSQTITFTLDGQPITAQPDETILQAAQRHGHAIAHLCYSDGLEPVGNCRACVVEIDGERVLAPSCCRYPQEGMQVRAHSERATRAQRMVLELLSSDAPTNTPTRRSELQYWREQLAVETSRFPATQHAPALDRSHPAIAVQLEACIHCTRCLRACRDVQVNDVIGLARRGHETRIVFDLDDPMGASSCVGCGECVQACPTGALTPANGAALEQPDRQVDSVCPYCGVGCLLTYEVKDERIRQVRGRNGPANLGRLCVKGRFGFDYVHHEQRITTPLIRLPGVAKTLDGFDPAHPERYFRVATWEEALDYAADGLRQLHGQFGPAALAGFGSAKGSNEEAYLFQKLVRTGFGSNNVDHCTRLCHASSVAALLEGLGSGAVSNPVVDVSAADVIIIIGANPTVNHPVAASLMKNAAQAGKTLILMDPRRTELARHAHYVVQFKPDSDVAMLNALLHVIIEEGLYNPQFIEQRTSDFELIRANVTAYSPEAMESVCGIAARTLRQVARVYARAERAMIFWGMGVSQHVHGTDNVRCLIALAMITGQIGRPGTGLHPLRGQNNVQGASDAGLIPMLLPDYQRVVDPHVRAQFERLWNCTLDPKPGLTVVEIMHAISAGQIKGMYIMGENPAMSDPNLNHARHALSCLQHLVVQDLFLTETAAFADVFLPASGFPEKTGTFTNTDRRVQMGRAALQPPGQAQQDWWIIQQIAQRLGLDWHYSGPQAIFAEMRLAMPSLAGITWERLEQQHSVTYPCEHEGDPGQPVIFTEQFPTASGKARLVPARLINADELPDPHYPWILITGRQLEHWHTGSMTRRSQVLDALEPEPVVMLNPHDLYGLGIQPGDWVELNTRRGQLRARARLDPALQLGQVFMAFCYQEAAANLLTNEALDPYGKIPEFKFCAVRVSAVGEGG